MLLRLFWTFYIAGIILSFIAIRIVIKDVINYFEKEKHSEPDDFDFETEMENIPSGFTSLLFLTAIPIFNLIVAFCIAANKDFLEESLIANVEERRK